MNIARCIGCGCDDNHACRPYGCSWLRVDYAAGVGVCSECSTLVAEWDQGLRKPVFAESRHGNWPDIPKEEVEQVLANARIRITVPAAKERS